MFRFEYNFPYSSCYTEPDLMYLAAKSKSFSFNRDRFTSNSGWMGVRIHGLSKKHADIIESKYNTSNKSNYGHKIGTKLSDFNREPFFYRWDNEVALTLRAIFAGRDNDIRSQSLRESCDAKCFVCNIKIEHEFDCYSDRVYGGVVLDTQGERFEIVCNDCFVKWIEHSKRYFFRNHDFMKSYRFDTEDQISFTRFVLTTQNNNNQTNRIYA